MPRMDGTALRVALAVLAAALSLVLGFAAGKRARPEPEPAAKQELADTVVVLVAVRGLARLEGVSFHMERIIDLKEKQPRLFGLLEVEDQILLVAVGDVVAGIDLHRLRDGDVVLEPRERRVRLTLPPPEILSARLDNERTYVHTRNTDLLADRVEEIETRARQHAEQSIREAALQAGILERAKHSTQQTLSALVRSLGYDVVEVVWAAE